jgi:hypothetical protein
MSDNGKQFQVGDVVRLKSKPNCTPSWTTVEPKLNGGQMYGGIVLESGPSRLSTEHSPAA